MAGNDEYQLNVGGTLYAVEELDRETRELLKRSEDAEAVRFIRMRNKDGVVIGACVMLTAGEVSLDFILTRGDELYFHVGQLLGIGTGAERVSILHMEEEET